MIRTDDAAAHYHDELFRLFVETVQDYAIFAMDADARIVHWNAGAERITGFTEAEMLGRSFHMLFTKEDVASGAPEQELRTALEMGRAVDERWHVRKDGSRFWSLGIVAPIRATNGSFVGFGKILSDRTDLKQLQETLERRNEALMNVDEHKNRFLATLAHELRNPLSVLGNTARALRQCGAGDTRVRELAEMIDRQVRHTTRLVDDLSDIARVRRGRLQLHRRRVDLRALAFEAAEAVQSGFDDDQRSLTVEVPDAPVEVEVDPDRIRQVLLNLLSNAMRYTEKGGRVCLTVTLEGGQAVVRVQDTGIGIPPDQLASIFELFAQAHSELPASQAGMGIGLALTRKLVLLHGGTIQASSEGHGKGSEFTVRLPALDGKSRSPA
ncbi:MAG TPA: PAS domain-containing sensor histidine kinase [Steroidobacteraceae bacterium]|jgi:PAS domain S-box-containing protein